MSIKDLAKRTSIRVQLFSAFGALLALMLGLGALSLSQVSVVRLAAVDLETNWLPSVRVLGELTDAANGHRFALASHVLNTDDAEMRRIDQQLAARDRDFTEARPVRAADLCARGKAPVPRDGAAVGHLPS